jgi:hypothetical protein
VASLGADPPREELTAGLARFARGDAYAATPRGRRFFDDNAWLGLASLRLAEVDGAGEHVDRAASLATFELSGEDPSGGVRWVEGGATRNTCSTASAAWLAAEVATLRDEPGLRAFAERSIDWLDAALRGPDDLYGDHVRADGSVQPTRWSYNQGAAIAAAAIVGRDPTSTARAALARFHGATLWREPPAFAVILFRALLQRSAVRTEAHDILAEHATRLLGEARDDTGWFVDGGIGSYGEHPTIDQAAVVQLLAFLALA